MICDYKQTGYWKFAKTNPINKKRAETYEGYFENNFRNVIISASKG